MYLAVLVCADIYWIVLRVYTYLVACTRGYTYIFVYTYLYKMYLLVQTSPTLLAYISLYSLHPCTCMPMFKFSNHPDISIKPSTHVYILTNTGYDLWLGQLFTYSGLYRMLTSLSEAALRRSIAYYMTSLPEIAQDSDDTGYSDDSITSGSYNNFSVCDYLFILRTSYSRCDWTIHQVGGPRRRSWICKRAGTNNHITRGRVNWC